MWPFTVEIEWLQCKPSVVMMPALLPLVAPKVVVVTTYATTSDGKVGVLTTFGFQCKHYGDFIMDAIASQITSLTIVYSIVYSDPDERKHQSSASLAFVRGIHRGPVNSPHKWPVTRKMFPFDDVIMRAPWPVEQPWRILLNASSHESTRTVDTNTQKNKEEQT